MDLTNRHREVWHKKPSLRAIYNDYYDKIIKRFCPGVIVEIGSGIGSLKTKFGKNLIQTDIQALPWSDLAADAHHLPFGNGTISNLILVDTLHHIEVPTLFFSEADRVLRPGGRMIMVEPAITPVSWFIYSYFHSESLNLADDPLLEKTITLDRDPFDANQAIPSLVFGRDLNRFKQKWPKLKLIEFHRFSLFTYLLSGGFKPWCLLPAGLVGILLRVERFLEKYLSWLCALRMFAVIEKQKL